MTSTHTVELVDDPADVLALARDLFAADPVTWSVVATVTERSARMFPRGAPRPAHPMWWAVVRDAGAALVAVAMRTMPHPPHTVWLGSMPADAARLLARAAVDRVTRTGEPPLTSANGPSAVVRAFMREIWGDAAATAHEDTPDRLWEARQVVAPPTPPPGRARRATLDDLDLVSDWFDVFHAEADAQAGRSRDPSAAPLRVQGARRRIEEGSVWLWEAHGAVVHLTAAHPASFGAVRIGPVYTPPEHRGRGYARALVALVAQQTLDAGHHVCLYTDRDNPVSGRVYAATGFEPVLDQVNLVVEPREAGAAGASGPGTPAARG